MFISVAEKSFFNSATENACNKPLPATLESTKTYPFAFSVVIVYPVVLPTEGFISAELTCAPNICDTEK